MKIDIIHAELAEVGLGFRDAANEAFRMMIPGDAQGLFTLLQHGVCTTVIGCHRE